MRPRGRGAISGALLRAAPRGHVTAIDLHAPFIEAARARWGKDARVTLLEAGDMTDAIRARSISSGARARSISSGSRRR